ncbi:hypothetical protein QAD02_023930 [Eretmocerus hayati]|uniref:Uncharacterized protein n=1 Tax=Eretmocerus hayati TaxID=131215 RepID=A0ACC2PX02_9HYME|nr:hypothetical protein QAD02_023930 [Eretmocerus hayati]
MECAHPSMIPGSDENQSQVIKSTKTQQSKDIASTVSNDELSRKKEKVGKQEKKKTLKDFKKNLKKPVDVQLKSPMRNLNLIYENKDLLMDFIDFLEILDKR